MKIDYILSLTYIDVIVPCDVLDAWEFGPLGLWSFVGRQWAPTRMYYSVLEPESFGYRPLWTERCTLCLEGAGIRVLENQHQTEQLMDKPLSSQGQKKQKIYHCKDVSGSKEVKWNSVYPAMPPPVSE